MKNRIMHRMPEPPPDPPKPPPPVGGNDNE